MIPIMASVSERPIQLGCFDARNGSVLVADDALPIAVEFDSASGTVIRVFSWPLRKDLRNRPTALDLLIAGSSILIASPAAGGIVDIDRHSGQATLIPLDTEAGTLLAGRDVIWAIARPDWHDDQGGGPAAAAAERQRAVIWEEPDDAEIARSQELTRGIQFRGRPAEYRLAAAEQAADGEPAADRDRAADGERAADRERAAGGDDQDDRAQDWLTAADWLDAEGDAQSVEPPTPIWRISAGAARRVAADLDQPILAAAGDRLAGVARLPSDPVIKHIHGDGSHVSYRYPGTAIVIDAAGTLRVAGSLPASGGTVCEAAGRVWLLGFDQETDADPAPSARELLPDEGRLAAPLDLGLQWPVAVVDRFVLDIGSPYGAGDLGFAPPPRAPVVRFVSIDGGEHRTVEAPGLSRYPRPAVRVRDGEVWLGNPGASTLTVAAPGRTRVRELALTLDIRPWMPRPQLPDDFDPERFEQDQLDLFRRWFLGGSQDRLRDDLALPAGPAGQPDDSTGQGQRAEDEPFLEEAGPFLEEAGPFLEEAGPFIEGVSLDSVELRGAFPDREVVATFQAPDRPGIRFARRWRLYDELGNPCDHEYASVYLEEDILAGSGGLPPLDRCVPDADGIVWFQHPDPAAG